MDVDKQGIVKVAADFQQAWQSGHRPVLNDFLSRVSSELRSSLLQQLLPLDVQFRQQAGEVVSVDDYCDLCESVGLDPAVCLPSLVSPPPANRTAQPLDVTGDYVAPEHADSGSLEFIVAQGPTPNAPNPDNAKPAMPYIGRYRIERVLGKGGFGLVYLAHDEQLDRRVAIKVPHAHLIGDPENIATYIAEARTVARLDHPHIVPVYDVGSTPEIRCFIVSKFIEGSDLAALLKQKRFNYRQAAQWVAAIAEALHYAHKAGLVHRDIKPGNILIGQDQQPYVVDFGLALREENLGQGPQFAGTPAYMSPEQARGEGHRVDGRSDLFSLGAVFYELLVGRRAFRGDTFPEVSEQIIRYEPRPPRQYDENIPKELERICHKALAKRATDRYSTGFDLAQDLRLFLQEQAQLQVGNSPATPTGSPTGDNNRWNGDSGKAQSPTPTPTTPAFADSQPVNIVPKGLRSFDANDADFFLELLPGPRDREGLPDSLRFWKTRIEETDPDHTFSVGLIYGPSGCGKSSLVKAGLLPRLSADVIAVYIEATPDDTETRLLHGLRKRCASLDDNLSLKDTLAALRRGQGIPFGKKVLIVLDQFEQWLHAKKEEENSELVQALRQCDGGRVQCIVMVRDDFWMAVTRCLRELEVKLVEGHNLAAADLFPERHAEKVLSAFGRAFGTLPDNVSETTKEQKDFLRRSVAGLAEEGKVICVRLALFAEMMKGKLWSPATLKEVGGTSGIGVTFLEETFSSSAASPEHRYHQKAARAVLKDLLPNSGADIKGTMRSYAELLEASGYGSRPQDFDDLIRILDSEIRLITPTDPTGKEIDDDSVSHTQAGQKYFQLTHDYLVSSLRDWLTRKQRETRRGRAELKLEERSAVWSAKPENKQLPSLWEFANIRLLTDRRNWTDQQRGMMSRATRLHTMRFTFATVAMIGLLAVGVTIRSNVARQQETTRIEGLVGSLLRAEPTQLPEIVKELAGNRELALTFLSPLVSAEAKTVDEKRSQLHARLALVSHDKSLIEPLLEELLSNNKIAYIGPIRQQLRPYAGELKEKLRALLRDEKADSNRRFRAALALADYIPESESATWTETDLLFVAGQLVTANAEFQPLLRRYLQPISQRLIPDLEQLFGDPQASDAQRLSAANAFADYAASDIGILSSLLTVATPEQYAVIYPLVAANPTPSSIDDLGKIAATMPPDVMGSVERIPFGQRRANAAVTLLRLGEREKVLSLFDWSDDPEALTQFIFRCRPRGIGVEPLLDLLELVAASEHRYPRDTRYVLMLAIGEFTPSEIPEARRVALVEQLADWYANDPSSGVHGAAGWLLRHLGEEEIVTRVDQTPVPYSADREWFTLAVLVTPTQPPKPQDKSPEELPKEDQDQQAEDTAETGKTPNVETTNENASEKSDLASEVKQLAGEERTETTVPVTDHEPDSSLSVETTICAPDTPSLPPKIFYYTFIVFPAGEYKISSPEDEPDRIKQAGQELQHIVRLTRPFAILDREMTYEEIISFKPKPYGDWLREDGRPASDPCDGVDWYDSVAFCRWLGQQIGLAEVEQAYPSPESLDLEKYPREPSPDANWAPRDWPLDLDRLGFRLPTDVEWEVATRGGSRTAYGFGGEVAVLQHFGWFRENSGQRVHATKELRPSIRGLFDLHGNLFEWTHDWYQGYSDNLTIDPLTTTGGQLRVLRGGSWAGVAAFCRSAHRPAIVPTVRATSYGFRLALSPSSQGQVPAEPEPAIGR